MEFLIIVDMFQAVWDVDGQEYVFMVLERVGTGEQIVQKYLLG